MVQLPADLKRIDRVNTYHDYQDGEGIPVLRGLAVDDLNTVELADWPRLQARGTFINLEGTGGTNDAFVCELAGATSTNPERHLFEEMIYVLDGSGSTSVWYDAAHKISFEWGAGSLFAIPLNAWHQHFNASGLRTARFLAVTNAPIVLNLFHNTRFVFDSPFVFEDRFSGQSDYFVGEGTLYHDRVLETNFVPHVPSMQLYSWSERGAGGAQVRFELARNTMAAHVSEFPVGTYKKAHRHGPGAHVIILSGQGYSLLWPEGGAQQRVNWQPGSMVVPPMNWFHQHFNNGAGPARYLALRWGSRRYDVGGAFSSGEGKTDVDIKHGGAQIEYADEEPSIHQVFEAELERAAAQCRMHGMVPWCTA
jgi:quercetin dioxygenase-like cupin family protein